MKKSIQTAIALFAAVTTTMCFTGCSNHDQSSVQTDQKIDYDKDGNVRLKDDNGNPYTLHKNADGTETARYDDGKEVTFRRDPDTNEIHYESGTSSLLTGMLMGYFLFHGFGGIGGSPASNFNYNPRSNTYTTKEPLQRLSRDEQRRNVNNFVAGSSNNSSKSSTSNSSNSSKSSTSSNSSNSNKSNSVSNSSKSGGSTGSVSSPPKSGFGSAGARGGAS